jgi:hypothetical protein
VTLQFRKRGARRLSGCPALAVLRAAGPTAPEPRRRPAHVCWQWPATTQRLPTRHWGIQMDKRNCMLCSFASL